MMNQSPPLVRVGDHVPPPPLLRSEDEVVSTWNGAETPELSICCATYNHRDFLEDALRGFLGQVTTFPIEIIVRDDASTDGTVDVLRDFAARYPNLMRPIYEVENQLSRGIKPGQALLSAVRGRYIALCEGDDYWTDPRKLQKQRDLLESRPEASCSFHEIVRFDESGLILSTGLGTNAKRDHTAFEMMAGLRFAHPASQVFRRTPPEVLFPPETQRVKNGDVFRYSILGQQGPAVYASDIAPAAYRQHSGGVWTSMDSATRTITHMTTFYWLAEYYTRLGGYPRVARACRRRHMEESLRRISLTEQCLLGARITTESLLRLPIRAACRITRHFRPTGTREPAEGTNRIDPRTCP